MYSISVLLFLQLILFTSSPSKISLVILLYDSQNLIIWHRFNFFFMLIFKHMLQVTPKTSCSSPKNTSYNPITTESRLILQQRNSVMQKQCKTYLLSHIRFQPMLCHTVFYYVFNFKYPSLLFAVVTLMRD